ncbi:hypothetical protein F5B19DRAFT_110040 [Rostrohypoxylon terebratum]|nr:hypothetical protein F5B19DRAFT_110040 [Rostrohypoxylon terebratum]
MTIDGELVVLLAAWLLLDVCPSTPYCTNVAPSDIAFNNRHSEKPMSFICFKISRFVGCLRAPLGTVRRTMKDSSSAAEEHYIWTLETLGCIEKDGKNKTTRNIFRVLRCDKSVSIRSAVKAVERLKPRQI